MKKILFDTSIYISFLREGKALNFFLDHPSYSIYLSMVVLQELYAGATDPFTLKKLDQFYHTLKKYQRVLIPTEEDWKECGIALSKIGKAYGFESIKKSRLVNDVLIALGCQNTQIPLVTANLKDFKMIQKVLEFELIDPASLKT